MWELAPYSTERYKCLGKTYTLLHCCCPSGLATSQQSCPIFCEMPFSRNQHLNHFGCKYSAWQMSIHIPQAMSSRKLPKASQITRMKPNPVRQRSVRAAWNTRRGRAGTKTWQLQQTPYRINAYSQRRRRVSYWTSKALHTNPICQGPSYENEWLFRRSHK